MLKEFRNLFKSKKGVLIILAMMSVAISAYLNIITVKSISVFGFNVSLGTVLVSFIPMITSEIMAEVYGWKKGFVISSVAYTICLAFVLILDLTTKIGFTENVYALYGVFEDPSVLDMDMFTASYNTVFAGTPWIIISSAIAYYLGIFFNCYIMGVLKKRAEESGKDNKAKLFGRFALSTIVGQSLDNGVFFLIPMIVVLINPALHEGALAPWSWNYVLVQTVAAFIGEVAYEIIFFPLTNFLTKRVKALPETL